MPQFKVLPAGDTALVVEFGETIDRNLSAQVLALAHRLKQEQPDGVIETVPTFRSLMIHYDPLIAPFASLSARIAALLKDTRPLLQPARLWSLPVCYEEEFGFDLSDVAARTGLSPADVIERHSSITYHVYMLGFLPGQAYMGDLPAEFDLRRRDTPRTRIPAGSLAVAARMTCIFPLETPCGWHVIGRSPVPLWRHGPAASALLAPGDKVSFTPVSMREYAALSARAIDGALEITPRDIAVEAAA
ncbi:MAG TPA: 5-oxoprolinase subunit PxpB [Xanthobacteraceae bacterium]|nr:5-oxoprolinase subunit PxpB [Xanthobacteraceae bacterium]